MQINRTATLAVASLGSLVLIALAGAGLPARSAQPDAQPQQPEQGGPNIGQALVDGLNDTEGCLKVLTARTSQGTNTIIAWFENKDAVERWYYSPTHKRTMRMVGAEPDDKKPMAYVKDADAPVMVMASITMGGEKVLPGPMPVSQISIELYTPLDAGAAVNGRLMPEEIELEHFNSIDTALID